MERPRRMVNGRPMGRTVIGHCKARPVKVESATTEAPQPAQLTVQNSSISQQEQALTGKPNKKRTEIIKEISGRVLYVLLGISLSAASWYIWL